MQLGFFIDQSRCIGCHTCVVACKDWYDIPAGSINWRWVTTVEEGSYPAVFVAFISLSCLHCAEPLCMTVCSVDAIRKRESDGIVVVDQDTCLGKDACGLCKEACPWHVPQFGPEADAKMQKCNFCVDQWKVGRKPICVEACPVWALDAGAGPFGASQWWSSDADDGELLFLVEAKIDTWTPRKARWYAHRGYVHYHELVSVSDGTLHPDKVVWLRHIATTSFTLDGGPHPPDPGLPMTPGIAYNFLPNWTSPYSP